MMGIDTPTRFEAPQDSWYVVPQEGLSAVACFGNANLLDVVSTARYKSLNNSSLIFYETYLLVAFVKIS